MNTIRSSVSKSLLALALGAGILATVAAATPATAAPFTVRCAAPSSSSDRLVAAGGTLAGVRLTELHYRLPNGQITKVNSASDPMIVAYAAGRGVLVQVCTTNIRRV